MAVRASGAVEAGTVGTNLDFTDKDFEFSGLGGPSVGSASYILGTWTIRPPEFAMRCFCLATGIPDLRLPLSGLSWMPWRERGRLTLPRTIGGREPSIPFQRHPKP